MKFDHSFVITCLDIVELHIYHEYDLLLHVVKRYNLVKKHQINVLERLLVLNFSFDGRLGVSQIIKRKISDQTTGKRRKLRYTRASVFL